MPVLEQIAPLIKRGQKDGVFRSDLPISWHLAVILAIVHAASGEVHGGRLSELEAESAMLTTVACVRSWRRGSVRDAAPRGRDHVPAHLLFVRDSAVRIVRSTGGPGSMGTAGARPG